MSEVVAHAPGTFCWVELGTTDAAAAKSFYADVFGWNMLDTEEGGTPYTFLQRADATVGALHTLEDERQQQGVPPHWFPYVSVEDAAAAARRTAELGGQVTVEPFDVGEHGRMAVLEDPTGAPFAVWQAGSHVGVDALNEPGTLCWYELFTRDTAAAAEFYSQLFGWDVKTQDMPTGPYTMFLRSPEDPAAGLLAMDEEWGEAPPHWMPYFGVPDCDAAVETARAKGGHVHVEPISVEGVGRFAVLGDPQGATFSVITFEHFGA